MNTGESIVSIVMPIHLKTVEELAWLREALDSALSQTVLCEIVAWDDGSQLNIKSVREDYPQVRWHQFEENKGVVAARNAAVEAATGPWILPLDHDDQLEPEAAQVLLNSLDGESQAFAYSDLHIFGPGVEMLYPTYDFSLGLLLRIPYTSVSILYPKEAWRKVGGYDARFEKGFEDWVFAIALALAGYKGIRVKNSKPLLWYRFRPGARRRQLEPHKKDLMATFRSIFSEAMQANPDPRQSQRQIQVDLTQQKASDMPEPELTIPLRTKTFRVEPVPPQVVDGNIRYIGPRQGSFKVFGRATGTYYDVSALSPILKVDARDYQKIVSRGDFEPYP